MRPRDRLVIPLAVVVALGWLASLASVIVRNAGEGVFLTASGLFGVVLGYVFKIRFIRALEEGEDS